jgi:hypothetical protein
MGIHDSVVEEYERRNIGVSTVGVELANAGSVASKVASALVTAGATMPPINVNVARYMHRLELLPKTVPPPSVAIWKDHRGDAKFVLLRSKRRVFCVNYSLRAHS